MTLTYTSTTERLRRGLRIRSPLLRNALAELAGTFLLVFLGTSNVAQFILSHEKTNTWIQINIGWGLAIMFSVWCCLNSSGGHLNPAISILVWSFGHISIVNVLVYSVAQTLGAFLGAAATYGVYIDAFNAYDGGVRVMTGVNATAGVFCSYPAGHLVGFSSAFIDQAVGTGFLALFAAMVIDERNQVPKAAIAPIFGALVCMIGMSFGMNLGYPINPARDLGPRLFSVLTHGSAVFSFPYATYWLAPVLGPIVGALIGGWFYHIFFGSHIPEPTKEEMYEIVGLQEHELKLVKN